MSEALRTLENHAAVIQSMIAGQQSGMIEKTYYDMAHPKREVQETKKVDAEEIKSRFINAFKE